MRSASPVRAVALVVVLAASAGLAPRALARPRNGFEAAHVDTFDARFELLSRADFEHYEVFGVDGPPREAQKFLFGQRIGARGTGSLIHPRFWRWSLSLNALFIEDLLEGDLASLQPALDAAPLALGDRYRVDAEYDARFTFLPEHPYPITLFATRGTQLVERIFQSNYWLTTSTYGATAAWHNAVFPVSVQYTFQQNDGEARELASSDEIHQVQVGGRHEGNRSTVHLDYRMTDYVNKRFDGVDYLIHRGELDHQYKLTPDGDWLLGSRLRLQRRETDRNTFTEARLMEQLKILPIRRLRLRVRYELAWWRLDAEDVLENVGWFEARHQLYRSLTTTLQGRVAHALTDRGDRLDGSIGGVLAYRKQLGPHVAMLHSYQGAAGWSRFSSDLAVARVQDEPVTLTGEIPARLAKPGVDLDTVEVVDVTGTLRYVRGRDFEVFASGEDAMLRRLLGGSIPEGATVLVSYSHTTSGVASGSSYEHRYTGRLESTAWDWLRVYAEYGYQALDRTAAGVSDNLTSHEVRTGVELARWNTHANAEYHLYSTQRFTAHELTVASTVLLPISGAFEPVIGVRDSYIAIDALGEKKNALQIFTEAQFPLGGGFAGSWRGNLTWEDGGANDGVYLNARAGVTWRWRKLALGLEYEARLADKEYEAYGRHSVMLNFRREL
ncbi:MAG: hypothetical protein EP329_09295 [Deltaproteobacteria bacterium]|nr:MAG: hypothetical protein EP329_09295 [Deltaproteobacteria bacterium]